MSLFEIRDMDAIDERFVGTCTHVDDTPDVLHRKEIDASAKRRLEWLQSMYERGSRVKVALIDGKRVGFLYVMPIEVCPWGPLGEDLMVIPCLVAMKKVKGKGVGRALIKAAEKEARRQGSKGLVTTAYYSNFWFMPAPFFEKCGFKKIKTRRVTAEGEKEFLDTEAILWKPFASPAKLPEFLVSTYRFKPVKGKVVVDLFWSTFCQTVSIEAQRVREVAAEFGKTVVLNEYCTDNRAILEKYQIARGIFINGKEIGWGYEAPKEGIREAINHSL